MSGPVDVLAVIGAAQASFDNLRFERRHGPDAAKQGAYWSSRIAELIEARTAVAELIEAAKEMMQQDAVQRATFNTNPFMADAADKLSSALGKVGAR